MSSNFLALSEAFPFNQDAFLPLGHNGMITFGTDGFLPLGMLPFEKNMDSIFKAVNAIEAMSLPQSMEAALIIQMLKDMFKGGDDSTTTMAPTTDTSSTDAPETTTTSSTSWPPEFDCSVKKTCGEMDTCEEAQYQLIVCGNTSLDTDGDGYPCEALCGDAETPPPDTSLNGALLMMIKDLLFPSETTTTTTTSSSSTTESSSTTSSTTTSSSDDPVPSYNCDVPPTDCTEVSTCEEAFYQVLNCGAILPENEDFIPCYQAGEVCEYMTTTAPPSAR